MSKPACIYCPAGVGSTRDHVPPRGFFQHPVPGDAQLITVPCCEACRKKDHANDELVRNILCSLKDTEPALYVAKHLLPRRDRAMEQSSSQILKMMGLVRRVVLPDEEGKAPKEDWAFSLDHPSIDQFLDRIGRALLFEEFHQGYFEATFGWRLKPPIPDAVYKFAVANYPKRNILDVIAYSVSPDLEGVHWIMVQFYGAIEFLLRYEKKS
jgi:hypothetical protein